MTASANLRATAVRLEAIPRSSMIAAAKAAKKVASTEGTRAGSPIKGHKRRGMPLRARDTIREAGPVVTCRIQGVNVAGWVWRNTGTAPHAIRRRKRGPRSKVFVDHPGSPGIGAWRRVVERAEVVVPAVFVEDVHRAVS